MGPVYRRKWGTPPTETDLAVKDELLRATYKSSLEIARDNVIKKVAFCLLSAGVFRGEHPLSKIVSCALEGILSGLYAGLDEVTLIAYTQEEQEALREGVTLFFSQPIKTPY